MRLIDYFDASAQSHPAKTAFIQPDGSRLTYAEAAQETRKIASALHRLCLERPRGPTFLMASALFEIRYCNVGPSSHLTLRWREMDSNFQYASTVTLVCAPTSSSIIGSPSMFPF